MKEKRTSKLRRLTALLCALALTLALTPPALAAVTYLDSDNSGNENVDHTTQSYLYANEKGGLTRVERVWDYVLVEEYDSAYKLLTRKYLPGGTLFLNFYAGKEYNFILSTGGSNPNEDDNVVTLRLDKYSKGWQLLGSGVLKGANTSGLNGAFTFAESGDLLFIHGGHTMYKSSDGKRHQANMTVTFRISDLSVVDSFHDMGGPGYVSHSLNGWHILADQGGNVVTFDIGDAHPRAAVVYRLNNYANSPTRPVSQEEAILVDIPGASGDNATGMSAGGLKETRNHYVAAYNAAATGGAACWLSFVSKADMSVKNVRLECPAGNTIPRLVSNGLDGGWVIWRNYPPDDYFSDNCNIYIASYSDNGTVGYVKRLNAFGLYSMSDCQPVLYNGRLVWYVTNYSEPVFYGADTTGVKVLNASVKTPGDLGGPTVSAPAAAPTVAGFTDVPANSPYKDAIAWAVKEGVAKGTSSTAFSPSAPCTVSHILTFLYRAAGSPNKSADERASVTAWAAGLGMDVSDLNAPCSRAAAVTYLWQAAGSPAAGTPVSFSDVPQSADYAQAVAWAVEKNITAGTSAAEFSPAKTCTRGQIVTFLYRAR